MKAVFLDRDGVINADRDDYVKNTSELSVYPFAPGAIAELGKAGWRIVVVSNQQGVAKGIIAESDLLAMEQEIRRQVEAAGGTIAAFYYCKHLAGENCSCRKPQPGLVRAAAADLGIDLGRSVLIGDTEKDIVAGNSAGCCRTILVLTGKLTRQDACFLSCKPDFVADNLAEAAQIVLTL